MHWAVHWITMVIDIYDFLVIHIDAPKDTRNIYNRVDSTDSTTTK